MSWALALLGSVVLHSAWQGALIAAAAAALLRRAEESSARTRYAIAGFAFAALVIAPVMTAATLGPGNAENAAVRTLIRVEVRHSVGAPVDDGRAAPLRLPLPAPPSAPWARASAALGGLWAVGAAVMLLNLGGGLWRVRRLRRAAVGLGASRWQPLADAVADRLAMIRRVRVVDATFVQTPTLFGWLQPMVLLPAAALPSLTESQVEAILAHELAHVRRHDYVANLVQSAAGALLFFHPAAWWLSARLRSEREFCCDASAVDLCGDRIDYAEALAKLETFRGVEPTLAMAMTGGALIDRVRQVLAGPVMGDPRRAPLAFAALLILIVTAGGVVAAQQLGGALPAAPRADVISVQWTHSESDHFELFVPPALSSRTGDLARLSERVYNRIAAELRHDLTDRPRIMFFENARVMTRLVAAGAANLQPGTAIVRVAADQDERELEVALSGEITRLFESDTWRRP